MSGGDGVSGRDNLAVVDAVFESFNARDWDRFLRLRAESVVHHTPASQEPEIGRAALREYFRALVEASPDSRVEKERGFGRGNLVCAEVATAHLRECTVFEFKNGEIVEFRSYVRPAEAIGAPRKTRTR